MHLLDNVTLRHAAARLDEARPVIRPRRHGRRVERRHVTVEQPPPDRLEAALLLVPCPQRHRVSLLHARRMRPQAEPTPVLRWQRQRHGVVRERQHEQAVHHVVGVQALALDRERVRRRRDDGLQLVRQRPALRRLGLLKLV